MALSKEKLEAIMKMRAGQEPKKPFGSTDAKYPLFKTPVGENLLVYIPTLNVVNLPEGGEYMNILETCVHDFKVGKQFGTIPCIAGISDDDPMAEELGYTGHTCPACDAVAECWQLIDKKVNAIASELGVDPQNDPEEKIKPYRSKAIAEMAIRNTSQIVTFPIVVIPHKKLIPTEDAMEKMQTYFVTMTKQRFNEKVCAGLSALMYNPGHIGGKFMLWQFVYDTKGQTPNARDAAKNAVFNIVTDSQALEKYEPYKAKAEEIASSFTNLKALEVLTALECKDYNSIVNDVNRVMKTTRAILAVNGDNDTSALPSTVAAEKALESFGATDVTNLGVSTVMGVEVEKKTSESHRFG